MNKFLKIDKFNISRAVITNIIYEKDPDIIRASYISGYDSPDRLTIKEMDIGFTPDITAVFNKVLNIYEIELGPTPAMEKWQLFSLYSQRYRAKLFLVVPDYLRKEIKAQLDRQNIPVGIIYFETKGRETFN